MLMLYFRSFLSPTSSSYFDHELTFPLFEMHPPTCLPPPNPPPPHRPPGWLFIKELGRPTLALLGLALWWQVSLTKIKELLVPEGWTLWSQPWKGKHPQREVQFMSELNLNSSATEKQSGFGIFLLRTIFQITDQISILVTSLNESGPRQQTKPMAHVQCNLEKVFSVFKLNFFFFQVE